MARLTIIVIITIAIMNVSYGQMVSTINGETWFNNQNLGRGQHNIITIVKDGQTFYQVETTRDGESKTVTLLPAPPGSSVQISVGGNSNAFSNNYVFQSGQIPTFAMPRIPAITIPNIPPVVVPEIRLPFFNIPQMTFPGYSAGSFAYSR